MSALVGMMGAELWGAIWMALALTFTAASVLCGASVGGRPRHPARVAIASGAAITMVVSTLDMALSIQLLSPVAWAAVLLVLMLMSLTGISPGARGATRADAAQHAAGFLFMAVMWLAMLPAAPAPAAGADTAASPHAVHSHTIGSLLMPLGWVLIGASALVVILVIVLAPRARRRPLHHPAGRHRWVGAQHASMGLSMSAMTVGMIVPLMFS